MGPMTPEEKKIAYREAARRWRHNHPEVVREKKRRYRERHRDALRASALRRSKTPEAKARDREWKRDHPRLPQERLLEGARYRARRDGRDFNLKLADILIPERCPLLDVPLTGKDAPSLDRVDNNKGYVRGNVRVISERANNLKRHLTLADLDRIRDYILSSLR